MRVELELEEWQRILAILATAPWAQANPLIMKLGEQLRSQQPGPGQREGRPNGPLPAEEVHKGPRPV
jgi:hypothetical protein